MPIPERFILWPNDSALNARDQVAAEIASHIDEAIAECDESDTCWLNDTIAYMCCLSAVGNTYSGLTGAYSRIEEWRKKVLEIYEWSWARQVKTDEYFKDREFIYSVLNSLFEAADNSTIPSAREPWTKC